MKTILTPAICLVLLGVVQLDYNSEDDLIKETWADGRLLTFSTTRPVFSRRATIFCLCEAGVLMDGAYVNGSDEYQIYSVFFNKVPDNRYSEFVITFLGDVDQEGRQTYHHFKSPWYEESQ